MSQICRTCNHTNRLDIDRALVSGKSKASVAREFGVSVDSLAGHEANHLSRQLVQAYKRKDLAESVDLMGRIDKILYRAEEIFKRNFEKATSTGDALALKALTEQRNTIELLAKIAAYLHEARALELQARDVSYEERQSREGKEFWVQANERLNDAESEMLLNLLLKAHGESQDEIVPPYEKKTWTKPKPVPTVELEEEDLEPENEGPPKKPNSIRRRKR